MNGMYEELLEKLRKNNRMSGWTHIDRLIDEAVEAIEALQAENKRLWQENERLADETIKLMKENAKNSNKKGELMKELKQARKAIKATWSDGRFVVLPCKVGDAVYEPFAGKVYEKTVDKIIINRFTTPQIWIETKLPFAASRLERWDMAFGKTVFLTREEAEKALEVGE